MARPHWPGGGTPGSDPPRVRVAQWWVQAAGPGCRSPDAARRTAAAELPAGNARWHDVDDLRSLPAHVAAAARSDRLYGAARGHRDTRARELQVRPGLRSPRRALLRPIGGS